MERLIIVSNRLPVKINKTDEGIETIPSEGGLATGIKSVYKNYDGLWIGWAGIDPDTLTNKDKENINKSLEKERCLPVYLNNEQIDQYYYGFSNRTIWPLFHYFNQYTEYNDDYWDYYYKVNKIFAETVIEQAKPGDNIWVQDYHLLLLPKMIKEVRDDVNVGFFLHIPFPSYEIFRILPWREEVLEGMLGADLLGFHDYDYERHFLSCVRRLIGHDTELNHVHVGSRLVKTDAFPMGIDYNKFHDLALENRQKSVKDKSNIRQEIEKNFLLTPDLKLVLSIDRLDYSKGIAQRLKAFGRFLEKYPQYREKVSLLMLSVPSRINVEQYKIMKSEVDELVGRINGKYASINWTPIWYFYRSLPFPELVELYNASDIGLITPVRDGMNLVAKEYVASRTDGTGVLILSEMAGAAKELSESILINPNNLNEIADALDQALNMSREEQTERNHFMQERIKRYDIKKWASDFMDGMKNIQEFNKKYQAQNLTQNERNNIIEQFSQAQKRVLFLDYDGTLVNYERNPQKAKPDEALYQLLNKLAQHENTDIVLTTSRSKSLFEKWFENTPYGLITEHGLWTRIPNGEWSQWDEELLHDEWKETVKKAMMFYVDRTPGSFIEEKSYALTWHFRKCDPDLGQQRAMALKEELTSFISMPGVEIVEGNKVVEVKVSAINKGKAAYSIIKEGDYDFIMAIGDGWTDEYLFEEIGNQAITLKVGHKNTRAKYAINSFNDVRNLLDFLIKEQNAAISS